MFENLESPHHYPPHTKGRHQWDLLSPGWELVVESRYPSPPPRCNKWRTVASPLLAELEMRFTPPAPEGLAETPCHPIHLGNPDTNRRIQELVDFYREDLAVSRVLTGPMPKQPRQSNLNNINI
ncbi:uncharacterized protein LOC121873015 [Homarus americanus]|uniref:uncharacterized protein LOC121873015 n=1 Tax=Homarus americanus TaxID=6706 RepID=UPI001C46569D|nr:uncharacterized protein LOC121873015 [Homarus americanus]XP_042232206.1 uncharacterized protein LOC121873015 [Homarus americanus]